MSHQKTQKKPETSSGTRGKPERTTSSLPRRQELWRRVGELASSSAMLLYLSEQGSDRLSLTQAAFFLLAATADAAGKPATRTELLGTHMANGRGSIRNSYRQLLEPSRVHPKALGWLTQEENPMDAREKVLRLSAEGKAVIEGVLLTLEPLVTVSPNFQTH